MTSRAIIRLGGLSLAGIAAVNNYLLPAFMIILGVALRRWPAGSARRSDANPEEEGVTNK
jgi:hypothetical protein